MRIWLLTHFYAPEVGAAPVRLSRLARFLVAEGHQVTVLTGMPNYPSGVISPPYKGYLRFTECVDGVDIVRLWVYASPSKSTRSRLLNQASFMVTSVLFGTFMQHPDVILVESHPLFVCLSAGWLHFVKRAPVVLNVSDLWPESAVATGVLSEDSLIVKLATRVERWAYRSAAHIIGMTQGVVDGIVHVDSRPDHVTLILNAVDLDRFRPGLTSDGEAIRHEYGLGDRFVVVHIGNMSLTYDFKLMIEVAETLPDLTFLMVGSGSQAEYVQQEVEKRGLKNVVFTGTVTHDRMPAMWSAANACIIALADHSVAGGTRPAKMYEALATGTPIVAAIRGEGAALLEETSAGIVVPIGDAQAMADALHSLASSPDQCVQLSKAGRAYSEKHLAAQKVAQEYLTALKKAARR